MQAKISAPGDGTIFHLEPGSLVRFKVLGTDTYGAFECYEREVPPQTIGADAHYHETVDEGFYVVSGHPTIRVGDAESVYGPGSTVVVPRMAVHAYHNHADEPMKLLVWFTPALNHHLFFQGLADLKHGPKEKYVEGLAKLRRRFGSVTHGGL